MKVVFDTNVVLDVLLARHPHVDVAAKLFALVDNGRLTAGIGATTVTTVFYIAAKNFGRNRAQSLVHEILCLFDVAAINKDVLYEAVHLGFEDHEDAVLHEAARAFGATAIVTRDRTGFSRAALPILEPKEMLAVVAAASK